MDINQIYNSAHDNALFSKSKKFIDLRKEIINNFNITPKIKKNNDSLKHLDPNILEFNYRYKNSSNKIFYESINENIINLEVSNGKINKVKSKKTNNNYVKIKNIDNDSKLIEERFLDFQNTIKDDYILNLNSLMLNSGYEINIDENQDANIFIKNSISENGLTIFQKNIITCAPNSNVFILEEHETDLKSNNNLVNCIDLEDGSKVTHLIFQKNSKNSTFQSTSFINCKNNSHYNQIIINISAGSGRNHHYANILGENSSVNLDGIFFFFFNQFIDNKTQVDHNFPNCKSSQRYKGILTDQANASYLSKTFVNKIAQKTEAYQLSRGILLSENGYFHSKPELRIFADDVKCSHGSTIGPIDKDLLFYLRSRGLSKRQSTSLLIKSFFHDIISNIENKVFLDKFHIFSNLWLKENNI